MSRLLPDWHIENYGINCTGTVAQYELFAAERREQLKPGDVVLLAFFFNDFSDNTQGSRHAVLKNGEVVTVPACSHLRPGWKRTLQDSSYLFNYLAFVANRSRQQMQLRRAKARAAEIAQVAQADPADPAPAAAQPDQSIVTDHARHNAAEINAQQLAQLTPGNDKRLPSHLPPAVPRDALEQVAVTRHYLQRWKADCEARQVRFLVAYIPRETELDEGEAGEDVAAALRNESAFRAAFMSCAGRTGNRNHRSSADDARHKASRGDQAGAHT